jgi:hypothetical protein
VAERTARPGGLKLSEDELTVRVLPDRLEHPAWAIWRYPSHNPATGVTGYYTVYISRRYEIAIEFKDAKQNASRMMRQRNSLPLLVAAPAWSQGFHPQ